jgi:hypothetical protein
MGELSDWLKLMLAEIARKQEEASRADAAPRDAAAHPPPPHGGPSALTSTPGGGSDDEPREGRSSLTQ